MGDSFCVLLFLWVQVDHIAKYGDDALAMYQRQIADLKTSGPILLNIKQREEMVVRMKSVVRYVMHISSVVLQVEHCSFCYLYYF